MKKFLNKISSILLVISIILIAFIIFINIFTIIRIMFFGIVVGNNKYPNSIWWGEVTLKGIDGVKMFYSRSLFKIIDLPIIIISIIYQILYFKIIKVKLKK